MGRGRGRWDGDGISHRQMRRTELEKWKQHYCLPHSNRQGADLGSDVLPQDASVSHHGLCRSPRSPKMESLPNHQVWFVDGRE